jgi:hypothetical protein
MPAIGLTANFGGRFGNAVFSVQLRFTLTQSTSDLAMRP